MFILARIVEYPLSLCCLISVNYPSSTWVVDVEVLNMETKQWRTINQLNTARNRHTMQVVNGILTVFGGLEAERSIEEYDGENWKETDNALEYDFVQGVSVVVPAITPN